MNTRIEYKLLISYQNAELNRVVNEHLITGWWLFGSPIVTIALRPNSGSELERYAQAVIRQVLVEEVNDN